MEKILDRKVSVSLQKFKNIEILVYIIQSH